MNYRSRGTWTSWSSLLTASLALACSDPQPTPGASGGGSGGSSGSASGAGSAGVSGAPGGGAPAAQAGQAGSAGVSGAPGAGGGAGGMNVAGGPPAFSDKPLSVIAYSPYRDGQAPGAAQPSQAQVRADLELLAPLVDGIRVYGTDGANAHIPALCDELGIQLHIGAWIDGEEFDEPNTRALAALVNENHPSIKTAIVGNEVLEREGNGVTEARLIELIQIARGAITNQNVKIAAADTYPVWMAMRPNLAAAVDVLIWHTYGYWAGAGIEQAYPLVSQRYDDMMAAYPNKPMLLGETGWPTQTSRMSMDMSSTAVGSPENQARFYRETLAGFRQRNLPVWMFSAIDEQWKASSGEGEVGAFWGIFDSQRRPKLAAMQLLATVP